MRSRIILIVVALLLGGVAAVAAATYLNGARAQLSQASQPVEVLVAQRDIPRGTPAEDLFRQKLVVRQEVPAQFVASGAISGDREISGQVLAVDLSSGEQLTTGRFSFPTEAGVAYNVPEDYVAVSLPVDYVSGVERFARPGDLVAVMVTEIDGQGVMVGDSAKTIIPKAKVLAVDDTSGAEKSDSAQPSAFGESSNSSSGSGSSTTQKGPRSVTLVLSLKDAEKAVFYAKNPASGDDRNRRIWLALLSLRVGGVKTSDTATLTPASE